MGIITILKKSMPMMIGVTVVAYFLGLYANVLADPDLWGYLAFGKLFWTGDYFPYRDVFAYTPTKAIWIYHEWLTGVLFFPIYSYLGAAGLQLLKYLVLLATLGLVYATAVKRGACPLSSLIVLFITGNAIIYGYSPVRAQVFSYFFFVLTLYILERYRRDQREMVLWWLLPIQLVWCNLHGGFLAGLGITVLYTVGEGLSRQRIKPYIRVLILSSVISVINPYGIQYWVYLWEAISMPRPDIQEWMSILAAVKSGQYLGVTIYYSALLFTSFFMVIWYRKRSLTDILILSITAYLGCRHIRHSIFLFLAFGIYIPVIFSNALDILKQEKSMLKMSPWMIKSSSFVLILFWVILSASAFIKFYVTPGTDLKTPLPYYPVGAIEWIKNNHLQGNILPHFPWGEYVIWRCYPTCRVAMDGRYETVYESNVQKEYFDFLHGRDGWKTFLTKYPHDMILIMTNSKTDGLLRKDPYWKIAYRDAGCVLYVRKTLSS